MNERINGLWWKARIGYNNQNCDPEVLEKFAELIVKECASLFPLTFTDEQYQRRIDKTILKHFEIDDKE